MISRRSLLLGLALVLFFLPGLFLKAQVAQDEVPEAVTLKSQYDEVQNRTRIYEGFRAIREDMFQAIKKQSLDSLIQAKQKIGALDSQLNQANTQIETLKAQLAEANQERDQALAERNSISVFGKLINKNFYSGLLWSIIAGLVILAFLCIVLYRNAQRLSRQRASDLHELLEEYETYRKTSRERLERITIDHFNEIKKLKDL
jgi:uncharacterized protein YoxC